MKLSTRARYALQAMIAIARLTRDGTPATVERIADSTGLPPLYLRQITIPLRSAKLVRGLSGRGGGYLLSRSADAITLAEIVEATIGPISIVDCVCEPAYCDDAERCESRLIYVLINRSITRLLSTYTLADLADRCRLSRIVQALDEDDDVFTGVGLDDADLCGCANHHGRGSPDDRPDLRS